MKPTPEAHVARPGVQVPNSKKKRDIRFQLSDEPIHRIQTLTATFGHAITTIDAFSGVSEPQFVRRDFDSSQKDHAEGLPVFNATHCYNGYLRESDRKTELLQRIKAFTPDQISALATAGANSQDMPRAALKKAEARLTSGAELNDFEWVHHWLEIYSRISYSGGILGFLIKQFLKDAGASIESSIRPALINHIEVRIVKTAGGAEPKYYDLIIQSQAKEEEQPPLAPLPPEILENYKLLQEYFEDDPGQSPEAGESIASFLAVPLYEYLYLPIDSAQPIAFGAFLGVILLSVHPTRKISRGDLLAMLSKSVPHLNAFAATLLEAEFEEILREDYKGDDPVRFLVENLHRIDGWTASKQQISGIGVTYAPDGITVDLTPDLFTNDSSDQVITLKPTQSDRWNLWSVQPDAAAKAYSLCLARRIRYFFEQATLQNATKQLGRRAERKFQFRAASHELKDLTSLIPKADGKPFMLRLLKDAFLDFSLPATGLSETKHRGDISPQLYGHQENPDGTIGTRCPHLRAWISELVDLAAGIQALAMSAPKKGPQDDEQLRSWKEAISANIQCSESLSAYSVPATWEIACYYGVTILCALRNIVKHSYAFDKTEDLSAFEWVYFWGSEPITIGVEDNSLVFCNRCVSEEKKPDMNGTSGAIEFYLDQLYRLLNRTDKPVFSNSATNGTFRCRLPLIQS